METDLFYTSEKRARQSLEHREPDRIPFDMGATSVTGIHRHAYLRLREYLGLPSSNCELYNEIGQIARVDNDIVEKLEIDVAGVTSTVPPHSKSVPRKEGNYLYLQDEWGITWRMPAENGLYFDLFASPLAAAESVAEVEHHTWPDPEEAARFEGLKETTRYIRRNERRAFVMRSLCAGIWEMSLWLCGFEKFFMDMVMNKKFAHAVLEKITELKMRYWSSVLKVVDGDFLIVGEADDLGTQSSQLCSIDLYREMISPYHKRLFRHIRREARREVYIFLHSCGAIRPFISDLIEEGVDILNPIQVNAEGMDPGGLKREFGKELTFWGGGVDTQKILPFGNPREVREETKRRIETLAPGGGFVFSTVHSIQADVPPENIVAMWETLQEYGVYQ